MGRDRLIKLVERVRFLVTTTDEEAFDGVLVDWDEGHFIFADVSSVAANGDRLHIDNDLWLPRPRIKYMQRVGG